MHLAPVQHHLPRAGIDRISSHESALTMLAATVHRPLRSEIVTILLDHQRRGVAVAVVTGVRHPDSVIEVVECLTRPAAHGGNVGAAIVASVRPGLQSPDVTGADIDRWLEISDLAERSGVELLEWFVVGHQITCPRDLLGEAPRW
jgi:hypothetical protein